MATQDSIRDVVIKRAAALGLSGRAIALATKNKVSADQVQRYLAGSHSITSVKLQHVFKVLDLKITASV